MNEFEKQLSSQPLKSVPREWREQILEAAESQRGRKVSTSHASPWRWLHELLWPCPQAWAGLAGIWVVIAAFHFISPGASKTSGMAMANTPVTSVAEERRQLAELLNAETKDRSPANRPRSARVVRRFFA